MHGKQFLVASGFHYAFAGVVNHDGALFGLLVCMSADIDKRLDDIVERMVVVVMNN